MWKEFSLLSTVACKTAEDTHTHEEHMTETLEM